MCGPEYMSLDTYNLFLQECKIKACKQVFVTFYLEQNPMLLLGSVQVLRHQVRRGVGVWSKMMTMRTPVGGVGGFGT